MAHKARINGTYYGIKGGKCRVNGTNYSIKSGKTKVVGTNYSITFASVATFYLVDAGGSDKVRAYQFLVGMTLFDWVESAYNTDGWQKGTYDGDEVLLIPDKIGDLFGMPEAVFYYLDLPTLELTPGQNIEYVDIRAMFESMS